MTYLEVSRLNTETLAHVLGTLRNDIHTVEVVDQTGSTNTELVKRATARATRAFFWSGGDEPWGAPSVLAARHQTAGKGRAGRIWNSAPDDSLTFSILLEADVPSELFTWLPLLAGTAVAQELSRTFDLDVRLKWPNDIVVQTSQTPIDGWDTLRKLGGLLVERVGQNGAVVGVGINLLQSTAQLPVPTATSLALTLDEKGADSVSGLPRAPRVIDGNELLANVIASVLNMVERWEGAGGSVEGAGLAEDVRNVSATLGSMVRVELPSGEPLLGRATQLAPDGALVVLDENGQTHVVHAGDVYHLRLH